MNTSTSKYDYEFYAGHATRSTYVFLARFLKDVFKPQSTADFGCGIGEVLRHLQDSGVTVQGLEGSSESLEFAKVDVTIADLGQPVDLGRRFDLVISTEVAEHLPEEAASQFVDNMVKHAKNAIFFTAAQPGQPGVGHINCQPKAYWAEIFKGYGFRRSRIAEISASFALYPLVWEMPWIPRNAQVFVKGWKPVMRAALLFPAFAIRALYWRFRISRLGGAKQWLPKMEPRGSARSR